jgi:hypothetical protein
MWQDWVVHAVDEFEHTTPCHCARSPASSSSLLLLLLLHGLCSNSPVEALLKSLHLRGGRQPRGRGRCKGEGGGQGAQHYESKEGLTWQWQWHGAVLHLQYSTVQYSTVQYSVV